ncbi:MAG: hypothetical protein IPN65_03350 [Elusimicrobia bacterium]|nr:hypothetical protein [Elusimicrobiota bacterium]
MGGTTLNGTYDGDDKVALYGGSAYAHAAGGEWRTVTEGGVTTTYDYDAVGNLRTVTLPSGTTLEYVIDGRNRRVGRKVNGTLTQGYLYDGQLRIVAELDGANNVTARYVYGTRPNVPEWLEKGGQAYRIITDHLGSPRLVVNAASGAIVQRMDYDSWGNITNDTNPGFQIFGYAGGLHDPDTKLTRYGARDYDARTGRWTAKDPIGFNGGSGNLYEYVHGDPVNSADPSGLLFSESVDIYNDYDDARKRGHQQFPGEENSYQRHRSISEEMTLKHGSGITRTAGIVNELQGLILFDIPDLFGRMRGERPWAFSLEDIFANEKGIQDAMDQKRKLCEFQQ